MDMEKRRAWYREWQRQRILEKPELYSAKHKRWREKNPEKAKEANRKNYLRRKEKGLVYDSKYVLATRERMFARNPEKREEYRLKQCAQNNKRNAAVRAAVRERKMAVGCIDCGFKGHPAALHFDHVTGKKEFNIASIRTLYRLEAEMAKCVVRCANCHAIKTWGDQSLVSLS